MSDTSIVSTSQSANSLIPSDKQRRDLFQSSISDYQGLGAFRAILVSPLMRKGSLDGKLVYSIIEQADGAAFMIITKGFCMSDTMPPTYFDFPRDGIAHLRASDEDYTLCGLSTNVYRPVNYGHLERCRECQTALANRQLRAPYWGEKSK